MSVKPDLTVKASAFALVSVDTLSTMNSSENNPDVNSVGLSIGNHAGAMGHEQLYCSFCEEGALSMGKRMCISLENIQT